MGPTRRAPKPCNDHQSISGCASASFAAILCRNFSAIASDMLGDNPNNRSAPALYEKQQSFQHEVSLRDAGTGLESMLARATADRVFTSFHAILTGVSRGYHGVFTVFSRTLPRFNFQKVAYPTSELNPELRIAAKPPGSTRAL